MYSCTFGSIGTNCAASRYRSKSVEERLNAALLYFVFVCHVEYILMQQEFGGLGRVLLGELPTPILQAKAGWG